jgi:predicted DNA binding CopG/RHH family protein
MIIVPVGTTVTISLSNGQLLTGKVETWSTENISLRTSVGAGITIITHPERDIVFIYYKENIEKNTQPAEQILEQSDQEFEEVLNQPFSDLKTKKLAELRILQSKMEKDIIANKLKSHEISDVKKVNYGFPEFFKKPGS